MNVPVRVVGLALACGVSVSQASERPLAALSLAELANVEVISVSKTPELLRNAAASIYVISREEIIRSGATSIPEALRLAPNLLITQYSASNYVVASQGLGGNPDAQNFSNKILMMIDGRSVYSPLFSGIYMDAQDVVLDDVERIEVINGPDATLWGANAVNGVINIITRSAEATQGGLLQAGVGVDERNAVLRYGDALGEGHYRLYGKAFKRDATRMQGDVDGNDAWRKAQAGGRFDWRSDAHTLTVQGDATRAELAQGPSPDVQVDGANALVRWQRRTAFSELQLQAYVDWSRRTQPVDGVGFELRTYDLELQQSVALHPRFKMVWGIGERINSYAINNSATLLFDPSAHSLEQGNVFARGTLTMGDVDVIAGVKIEHDPYTHWSLQPDVRLVWRIDANSMAWAAASRALRAPTPFDKDVIEKVGTLVFLTGNDDFKPERLTSYQVGYRRQWTPRLSGSVSAFYNWYDDLRSIETASATRFLPLHWGNLMHGSMYGAELWSEWQVTDRWRLTPSFRYLHKDLSFDDGASKLLGVAQAGNDPPTQASLKSTYTLGVIDVDAWLRYVGALASPYLPAYHELNARIAWHASPTVLFSLTGFNLLHRYHQEYPAPIGNAIPRSVLADVRWNF